MRLTSLATMLVISSATMASAQSPTAAPPEVRPVAIHGFTVDASGLPLPHCRIQLHGPRGLEQRTVSAADGRFDLGPWPDPLKDWAFSLTLTATSRAGDKMTVVHLPPSQSFAEPLQVSVTHPRQEVKVKVRSMGKAVADAQVQAFLSWSPKKGMFGSLSFFSQAWFGAPAFARGTSDAQGLATLDAPRDALVTFLARNADGAIGVAVTKASDLEATVDLVLSKPVAVRPITVVDKKSNSPLPGLRVQCLHFLATDLSESPDEGCFIPLHTHLVTDAEGVCRLTNFHPDLGVLVVPHDKRFSNLDAYRISNWVDWETDTASVGWFQNPVLPFRSTESAGPTADEAVAVSHDSGSRAAQGITARIVTEGLQLESIPPQFKGTLMCVTAGGQTAAIQFDEGELVGEVVFGRTSPVTVKIIDEFGKSVPGLAVHLGKEVQVADRSGEAHWPTVFPGSHDVKVGVEGPIPELLEVLAEQAVQVGKNAQTVTIRVPTPWRRTLRFVGGGGVLDPGQIEFGPPSEAHVQPLSGAGTKGRLDILVFPTPRHRGDQLSIRLSTRAHGDHSVKMTRGEPPLIDVDLAPGLSVEVTFSGFDLPPVAPGPFLGRGFFSPILLRRNSNVMSALDSVGNTRSSTKFLARSLESGKYLLLDPIMGLRRELLIAPNSAPIEIEVRAQDFVPVEVQVDGFASGDARSPQLTVRHKGIDLPEIVKILDTGESLSVPSEPWLQRMRLKEGKTKFYVARGSHVSLEVTAQFSRAKQMVSVPLDGSVPPIRLHLAPTPVLSLAPPAETGVWDLEKLFDTGRNPFYGASPKATVHDLAAPGRKVHTAPMRIVKGRLEIAMPRPGRYLVEIPSSEHAPILIPNIEFDGNRSLALDAPPLSAGGILEITGLEADNPHNLMRRLFVLATDGPAANRFVRKLILPRAMTRPTVIPRLPAGQYELRVSAPQEIRSALGAPAPSALPEPEWIQSVTVPPGGKVQVKLIQP